MSFVTTQPEAIGCGGRHPAGIGSTMSAQNAAAAAPTTGVVPAAADEVSALTAAQFAAHAQMYQAVSAQAAAIHEYVREHPADQLRLVRGHRGRQRSRCRLTRPADRLKGHGGSPTARRASRSTPSAVPGLPSTRTP